MTSTSEIETLCRERDELRRGMRALEHALEGSQERLELASVPGDGSEFIVVVPVGAASEEARA